MLLVLGASFGLAACGGSGTSSGSPSNASAASTGGTIIVTGTGTTAGSTQGPTTPSTTTTQNLVVTNTIRGQLLAAGAALHQLPVSDYTGLRKGETYYAFDPATNEHWAGAALVASKSSIKAQVGDQDDGAYLVFRERAGGAWKAWDAGIPGSNNYTCAVKVPASVLAVWNWAAGTCHPRSSD